MIGKALETSDLVNIDSTNNPTYMLVPISIRLEEQSVSMEEQPVSPRLGSGGQSRLFFFLIEEDKGPPLTTKSWLLLDHSDFLQYLKLKLTLYTKLHDEEK